MINMLKKNKFWTYYFLSIFTILVIVFLIEFKLVGQAVYGDGRYYLAFTRSIYFSKNIDITDEMSHPWDKVNNNLPVSNDSNPKISDIIKKTTYNFSLGVSVVWLPFFFVGDILILILQKFGMNFVRNGYSDIYQITLGIGNILFSVLGLIFLSKSLLKLYRKEVVALSIILILFATNLFYYSGFDVNNSHPFSFFAASIIIYLFIEYKKRPSVINLFIQSLVVGLMISNRFQDGLFIVFPIFSFFITFKKDLVKKVFVLILGGCMGYLPQLLILCFGQGKFILIPHILKAETEFVFFAYFKEIIFSQKLGLLFYTPLILFSFLGLYLFYKRKNFLGKVFCLVVILDFLLILSYHAWDAASYSLRYFISILPILVFGIAEIIIYLRKKFSIVFISLVTFAFILHQALSIFIFKIFWQDATYVNGALSDSGKIKMEILNKIFLLIKHLS